MTQLEVLPFVEKSESGSTFKLWCPDRSGTESEQCARGREYATSLATFIYETDNPVVFLHTIRSIPTADLTKAVETGFLTQISFLLAASQE